MRKGKAMKDCSVPNEAFIADSPVIDGNELETLKWLVLRLSDSSESPSSMQQKLNGLEGMKRLVAAMTFVLIDIGGTTPGTTCDEIAAEFPDLYDRFGEECILALCERDPALRDPRAVCSVPGDVPEVQPPVPRRAIARVQSFRRLRRSVLGNGTVW
jgi:hypothetical protein